MTLAPALLLLPQHHLPDFFTLPRPFHRRRPGLLLGGPGALKVGPWGKGAVPMSLETFQC